ncbi:hypothetical protein KC19_1G248400 [Ceratodon purpureus]|uniref:Pectinesterase n=1 Tax=Ceratodon purpureus TaxID=3225 RepID=A0A8T0JBD1_CERPU|nr:hypothetical protein KC19_1G248400 [Ceratodon purpureus]
MSLHGSNGFSMTNLEAHNQSTQHERFTEWLHEVQSRAKLGPQLESVDQITPALEIEGNFTIIVDQEGNGDFVTVQAAIDAVATLNSQRVTIHIRAGIYLEKVVIPKAKPYITLQGEGSMDTVLEWNDTASNVDLQGNLLSTYHSATVAVESIGFVARNLTFKNSAPPPPNGAFGRQAAAIRISGDMAAFHGCRFLGAQDTLYDHKGRHYFQDCYIEGSIDFIFGDGLSQYRACELHAISHQGAFTAQKRKTPSDNSGFSFVDCKVTGSGQLYLGRAWGLFARVVFAFTYMEDVVDPRGWSNWDDAARDMSIFFGQYNCFGPGSAQARRVSWAHELSFVEAQPFLSLAFVDGEQWVDRHFLHLEP